MILLIIERKKRMALNLDGEQLIRFQPPRLSKVDFCNHCLERKLESFRMKWRGSPGWIGRPSLRIFQKRILNILRTKFLTKRELWNFIRMIFQWKYWKVISYRVIEYVIFPVFFAIGDQCICYIKMNNWKIYFSQLKDWIMALLLGDILE